MPGWRWFPHQTVGPLSVQTFEAKIHHLETRQSGKATRDQQEALEYFVRCELHRSDVGTLISSIKRIAEDVRTTKEVKGKVGTSTTTTQTPPIRCGSTARTLPK